MNRLGPSRSSTATAGTFSEYCSASRGADLALESAVEIGRRVIAEMARPVVEQRLRVDDQPVERHRVDERLQRRSRRAHRPRHVERAAARRPSRNRRCRHRRGPAARGCRRRSRRASPADRAPRLRAAAAPRPGAAAAGRSSCAATGAAGVVVAQRPRQMRRVERHREPDRAGPARRAPRRESARRDHPRLRPCAAAPRRAPRAPPRDAGRGAAARASAGCATSSAASAADRRAGSLPK